VSGTDRTALDAAIAPWRREPWRWTEVEPTLEDVFIQLMGRSDDNFAAAPPLLGRRATG
jgi:ABC-2 type transport system ATP-binding protein